MPEEADFMVGVTDSQGNPMACGGNNILDPSTCYRYSFEDESWSDGPSLLEGRAFASSARLSDGSYWVTGGS